MTVSSSASFGSSEQPGFDGELDSIRKRIDTELECAVVNRGHGWRTPVLATIDARGNPDARTVVLRGVDTVARELLVYTDCRSPKVGQIADHPAASFVFWSAALNWQLRIAARLRIEVGTPRADAIWAQLSSTPAARDYLSPAAPGQPLVAGPGSLIDGRDGHHLAIVVARIERIDWLELGRKRHRRAVFEAGSGRWCTP